MIWYHDGLLLDKVATVARNSSHQTLILEPVTERNLRPTRAGLCAPASAAVVMVGLGWAPGHCVSLCWWGCCWCTLGSLCRTENSTQSTLTLAQAGLGRRTRHGTAE